MMDWYRRAAFAFNQALTVLFLSSISLLEISPVYAKSSTEILQQTSLISAMDGSGLLESRLFPVEVNEIAQVRGPSLIRPPNDPNDNSNFPQKDLPENVPNPTLNNSGNDDSDDSLQKPSFSQDNGLNTNTIKIRGFKLKLKEGGPFNKSKALDEEQRKALLNSTSIIKPLSDNCLSLAKPTLLDFVATKNYICEFSVSQLLEISTKIADFYNDKGFETSGAVIVLPKNWQDQGEPIVATIEFIEGKLEAVNICLDSDAIPKNCGIRLGSYVKPRLGVKKNEPLNITQLKESLQILQIDPLIRRISATLADGNEQGNTRLTVTVTPEDEWDLDLTLDNARPPSVGSFQRQVRLNKSSAAIPGDNWNAAYLNTDGSHAVDASYSIPVNPQNGRLSFRYSHTESDIIEAPFDQLDIESASDVYEVSFRQPVFQKIISPKEKLKTDKNSPQQNTEKEEGTTSSETNDRSSSFEEFALGLTGYLRDSSTRLLGEPFSLSRGSEADGRIRVVALRFSQDWSKRNASQVFAARSEFSAGLNVFDATTNEFDFLPSSNFFAWRGQFQYAKRFGYKMKPKVKDPLLVARLYTQLANGPLFGSEQFAAGGATSVRGYREDLLQSDSGFLASAEMRVPITQFRLFDQPTLFQVVPFIDGAYGWNIGDVLEPDPNGLVAVGLGLQLRGNHFAIRLDYGIPLISGGFDSDSLQENGLHLSVTVNPL